MDYLYIEVNIAILVYMWKSYVAHYFQNMYGNSRQLHTRWNWSVWLPWQPRMAILQPGTQWWVTVVSEDVCVCVQITPLDTNLIFFLDSRKSFTFPGQCEVKVLRHDSASSRTARGALTVCGIVFIFCRISSLYLQASRLFSIRNDQAYGHLIWFNQVAGYL